MIEVSEIFRAPQGEGPNLGRPSLFLRMRRCTLHCAWCDTKYSWDKNDPGFQQYETYDTPADLAEAMLRVSEKYASPPQAVVLTGGEPLIWQRDVATALLLYRSENPIPVEVETSGTIMPSDEMLRMCNFNVSHKLASAGNTDIPRHRLWDKDVVRMLLGEVPLSSLCFKPVVDAYDVGGNLMDYIRWIRYVGERIDVDWDKLRQRIYLMPQARDVVSLAVGQKRVIQLAEIYGVRCTTRLHLLAYGGGQKGT